MNDDEEDPSTVEERTLEAKHARKILSAMTFERGYGRKIAPMFRLMQMHGRLHPYSEDMFEALWPPQRCTTLQEFPVRHHDS